MDESGFISAFGGGGHATFADVVAYLIAIINGVVWVLGSLALLLFMWGAVQYIYKQGTKDKRKLMLWSLLALFVLFTIWGILRIMCATFLGNSCSGSGSAPLNTVPVGGAFGTGAGGPSRGTPGGTGGLY